MPMMRSFMLSLLVSFFLVGCQSEKKPPQKPPADVTSYTVEQKDVPVVFNFIGFAASPHPVEIRARVEGYLEKIAYDEGQLVKKGQLMFQLDPKLYEADVSKSKAEVARQEALLVNANLTVDRLTPLYQKNAASKKDLDNAIANQLATEASLLAAKAQLQYNEVNLSYTTITSPITGYSDKAKFREGALINPASNSLLTTVSVIDPIWIYFTVSDNDILRTEQQSAQKSLILPKEQGEVAVDKGNKFVVEAVFSDNSTFNQKGIVDYSSPTYDQATGTMQVRAVFPNPQALIRPGQFMRVKVLGAERPHAIMVPRRALMQNKNGMYVYLINHEDKVVAQDVSTAEWHDEYQVITNGLKPGDKIVVDGINKLLPGDKVHIVGQWKETKTGQTK